MAVRALAAADDPSPGRLAELLPRAVRFYLDERDAGRDGWLYPSFLAPRDESIEAHALELDADLWEKLEAEAGRQRAEPGRLLQHVAFYYAAARDEGRMTERIARELSREMEGSGEREVG